MAKKLPFKIGDTVTLNSGGDLMTIVAINRKGVTCGWQVKGQPKSKLYPSAALTKAGKPFSFEQIVSDGMKLAQERREQREKEMAAKIDPQVR